MKTITIVPRVSVIIPTYNRENTILRVIDSVLDQTVKPHEILICDDGSTDDTEALVKKIIDKRIHWISGKHSGLPAVSRNIGIKKSKGEWLAFLDSDDRWEKDKLENQLKFAKQNNLLAVSTNASLIRQQTNRGKMLSFNAKAITFHDLINTNYVICSSAIVHKSLFNRCIGFPEDPSLIAIEDYALWLRITTQTSFAYINEPLVYYNDDIVSIRSKGPQTVEEQKKRVFNNFLTWSKNNTTLAGYRTKIETAFNNLRP